MTLEAPRGASYIEDITLRDALTTPGLGAKVMALATWWPNSRLGRTLGRYFTRDGDLMASGLALTILISLTAAMTVALTVFMAVLGNYDALREATFDIVNTNLPGLLKTDDGSGLVDPMTFVHTDFVSPTSAIALLIAAWTGMSLVGRLGRCIRTMFGVVITPEGYHITVGRNLAGALALMFAVIVGGGVGIIVDLGGMWLLSLVGLENSTASRVTLAFGSYAIPFLVHMVVSWVLIRVVAGIRVPKRDLRWGLAIMAALSIVLRILGTGVVGSVQGPVLATATTLITLVLWINLQMRITLMVSAWMSNPPRAIPINSPEEMRFYERPNYVTMSVPDTLEWPRHEVTGELAPAPEPAILPTAYQPGIKRQRTLTSWLFGPAELRRSETTAGADVGPGADAGRSAGADAGAGRSAGADAGAGRGAGAGADGRANAGAGTE